MKKLSQSLLADIVSTKRKAKNMTQQELSDKVGINRALLSRLEQQDFLPSIPQLENLAEVLGFEPSSLFINSDAKSSSHRRRSTLPLRERATSAFPSPRCLHSTTMSQPLTSSLKKSI